MGEKKGLAGVGVTWTSRGGSDPQDEISLLNEGQEEGGVGIHWGSMKSWKLYCARALEPAIAGQTMHGLVKAGGVPAINQVVRGF